MIAMIFIGLILNHLHLLNGWVLVLYVVSMMIEGIVELVRIAKLCDY